MSSSTLQRRRFFQATGATLAAASLPTLARAHDDDEPPSSLRAGKVFTSTNAVAGNEVLVFGADADGGLALRQRIATQGSGTGGGLGSQDALRLSGCGRWLFVVNAGSHSISTLRVGARALRLMSVANSGGSVRGLSAAGARHRRRSASPRKATRSSWPSARPTCLSPTA